MRKQLMSTVTLVALVTGSLAPLPIVQVAAAASPQQDGSGFCRTAAALPQLDREPDWQAQRDNRDRGMSRDRSSGGDVVMSSPVLAPPPPPPPPPMAPPSPSDAGDYVDSSDDSAIMVTGSRRTDTMSDSPLAASAIGGRGKRASKDSEAGPAPGSASERSDKRPGDGRVAPTPYPQPQPQSGLLTAGEHDDLLNPELYAAYVRRSNLAQSIRDLPRVDTMRVVTVKVADGSGRPVPFADVVLTCSDGNQISMATHADGTAVFFPGLDRLSERVSVSARKGGAVIAAARPVLVADAPGGQTIGLTADAAASRVDKLDLMFVIDTTGSMGDEISYLQSELRSIIGAVTEKHRGVDIRLGFVFYRDIGDDYVTYTVGFDRDVGAMQGVLARQSANGGGDYPEAMDQAMVRAVGQSWRPDAVKSLMLVADAPPHNDKFGRTWAAAEAARAKRIQITPIAASGVAGEAEYAMRAMAAATQSRYLFLTDDSGIGNSHAPPAIDCYLVTRLDALVRRVIDSQLSGRRVEPEDAEIIRSVGKYDAGKCILPPKYRWDQS